MEGLITVVASVLSIFVMVPFPENNNDFTGEEKSNLMARIAADKVETSDEPAWKHTLAACHDVKVWLA